MTSLDAWKRIQRLNFHLFGGITEEEFYERPPERTTREYNPEFTGSVELEKKTGKITNYDSE